MKNIRELYWDNERWRLVIAVLLGAVAAPLADQGGGSETLEDLVLGLIPMVGLAVFVSLVVYHITLIVKPIERNKPPDEQEDGQNTCGAQDNRT